MALQKKRNQKLNTHGLSGESRIQATMARHAVAVAFAFLIHALLGF